MVRREIGSDFTPERGKGKVGLGERDGVREGGDGGLDSLLAGTPCIMYATRQWSRTARGGLKPKADLRRRNLKLLRGVGMDELSCTRARHMERTKVEGAISELTCTRPNHKILQHVKAAVKNCCSNYSHSSS